MSFKKNVVVLIIGWLCWSCNNENTITKENKTDTAAGNKIFDIEDRDTPLIHRDTGLQVSPDSTSPLIRTGFHDFTLHWISWDRPGKVTIKPAKNGWHTVSGSQNDGNGNFITIEGELRPVSPLELRFRGLIQTRVETINNGDTCTRSGEQTFLSTKNRKYWRLQQMQNCEGGMLVDYIDIYF